MTLSVWDNEGKKRRFAHIKFHILRWRIAASSLTLHKNDMSFRKNPPQTNLKPKGNASLRWMIEESPRE
jgi:hypothetical protein